MHTPHRKKRGVLALLGIAALVAAVLSLAVASTALATSPSVVYANSAWGSVPNGNDPDGAGPATAMGTDAFADLPSAEAGVANAGTVYATGTFDGSNIAANKAVTLDGQSEARIVVPDNGQVNGINIVANDVTVKGFEIVGPVDQSYLTYSWGSNISRGIVVSNGVTGFNITDNNVHGLRNGILIDGRNSGSVTGNTIDNTKSAVSIQYTDGSDIVLTGNSQGSNGNEWGVNQHLNGYWDGSSIHSNPYPGGAAPSNVQQSLLDDSAANGGWTVQDQAYTSSNRTEVSVSPSGSASNQGSPLKPLNTVQAGVDAVVSCGNVNVAAGTYNQNVTISNCLTLNGAQAGIDGRARSGNESVMTGYLHVSSSNVTVDGFSFSGAPSQGQLAVSSLTTLSGVVVQNDIFTGYGDVALPTYDAGNILIRYNLFANPSASGEAIQIKASSVQGGCNGSQVLDNVFNAATNNGGADVNFSCTGSNSAGVTVSGNTTTGDSGGSSFTAFSGVNDDVSVSSNTGTTDGSSIFFFGNMSGTTTISNNSFTGGPSSAVAIFGGEFTSDTPNSGTFVITDNNLSANARGIRVTANGLTSAGRVVAHGNNLAGSTITGVANLSPGTVDATANWWGSASGPGTLSGVLTKPWCTDNSCTTRSDNADLSGLSLSSGTLSPAFDSSTTAYSASVDNSVNNVSVNRTSNAGATTALSGGSNLAVGNNTVKVTVTSADSSVTKVYTITVSRAAAPSSGGTPPPTTTTTPTPPPANPPVDKPQSAPATPTQSGAVAVAVSQPAPTGAGTPAPPVTVTTKWDPGTFTVPVTVLVTPQVETPVPVGTTPPPPTPVAGGFTVGSTTVQLTVTNSSGVVVHQFVAPLTIHISASEAGDVPAYSQDGSTWTIIPQLSSPELPAGQSDGYYRNADGSVDIYTRHATLFGLLKDAQAPNKPILKVKLSGKKLYLSITGAKDNVRVTGYRLSFNGRLVKNTARAYMVLSARAGHYQVQVFDAAGNRGKPATITVVRHKKGFAVAKS